MTNTNLLQAPTDRRPRIAILDDYLDCALTVADWSAVLERADVTVFREAFSDQDDAVAKLQDFDVLAIMRERTPLSRAIIERLPNLRMIAMTGVRNPTLDAVAAQERGIVVSTTTSTPNGSANTVELAWTLILSLARWIPSQDAGMRKGEWQTRLGCNIAGKKLGLIGLGRLGAQMVPIARAFQMDVVAWSPNLNEERAAEACVAYASKEELFSTSDFISIHMVLSAKTRGLIGTEDLGRMKPSAFLVNTARGPLVDEQALLEALNSGKIAGAGLDVYDREPLPVDHPLRSAPNTVLSPQLGFATREGLGHYYTESIKNIIAWLDGKPQNLFGAP